MLESVVKLHEISSVQPSTTAGDQAMSRLVAECGPLRPPAATYLVRGEIESRDTSAPIRINDSTNARPGSHDPEKERFQRHTRPSRNSSYQHSRVICADDGDDVDDNESKEHAFWILIYLSALSPLLALSIAPYTLLMGTLLLLLFPLCFCLKQIAVCAHCRHFLSPLLVLQLKLVYSSCDRDDTVHSETSGIMVLVLVSMLSPLYAMAIAVAAWVAGVFWFYTAMLGNPDGREDRDDGRETVLAVRGWWERWLIQCLEPKRSSTLRDDGPESGC